MKDYEMVDHPQHYNQDGIKKQFTCECGKEIIVPIECVDVIRDMPTWKGNAIKYLWRAGEKPDGELSQVDKEIEDCRKAIWYINDRILQLSFQRK